MEKRFSLKTPYLPYFSSALLGTLAVFLFFAAVLLSKPSVIREPEVYQEQPYPPPSPSLSPSPVSSPSPTPTPTPSIPPSPSPGVMPGITLQVKLDGVPANNNDHCGEDYCNLPEEFKTQNMIVLLEKEIDGTDVYEAEVEFKYIGDGIWEGTL